MARVDLGARVRRPAEVERKVLELVELRATPGQDLRDAAPGRVKSKSAQGLFDDRRRLRPAPTLGVQIDFELGRLVGPESRRDPDGEGTLLIVGNEQVPDPLK